MKIHSAILAIAAAVAGLALLGGTVACIYPGYGRGYGHGYEHQHEGGEHRPEGGLEHRPEGGPGHQHPD